MNPKIMHYCIVCGKISHSPDPPYYYRLKADICPACILGQAENQLRSMEIGRPLKPNEILFCPTCKKIIGHPKSPWTYWLHPQLCLRCLESGPSYIPLPVPFRDPQYMLARAKMDLKFEKKTLKLDAVQYLTRFF